MLKTISAALLAVSVLAAPALAAGPAKTTQAPTVKSEQAKSQQAKSEQAKTKTTAQAKTGVLKDRRAERQCQNGPPSPQAFRPSPLAQAHGRAQDPQVLEGLEGLDQARCACHQARLKLIRGRGLTALPPAATVDIRPGLPPLLPQ